MIFNHISTNFETQSSLIYNIQFNQLNFNMEVVLTYKIQLKINLNLGRLLNIKLKGPGYKLKILTTMYILKSKSAFTEKKV